MNFDEIFALFQKHNNSENATKMSAYMKNHFKFLGIPSPLRKNLLKDFLKSRDKKNLDWDFVFSCWENPYREMQYVALDYLHAMQKVLVPDDIPNLKKLIVTKSWWDSIDNLDRIVGRIALVYPELDSLFIEWSRDDNIWIRRVAIDHQLGRKDATKTEVLETIIKNNF